MDAVDAGAREGFTKRTMIVIMTGGGWSLQPVSGVQLKIEINYQNSF